MPVVSLGVSIPLISARTDIEAELARALTLLEEVERQYERQRSTIEAALHPQVWKDWKLTQLDRWRQDAREPLVRHMAALYQRDVSTRLMNGIALNLVHSGETVRYDEPRSIRVS